MTLPKWILGAVLAATAIPAVPAHADWDAFWARVKKDFHRVNAWPAPFYFVDRDNTREPFRTMVAKGWTRQNTLGDTYFNPETQQLTAAGEQRVRGILLHSPPAHRAVYVVRPEDASAAERRISSVHEAIARFSPDQPANVLTTNIDPPGWSAEYINTIGTKMIQTIPDPRLPNNGAGAGASASR